MLIRCLHMCFHSGFWTLTHRIIGDCMVPRYTHPHPQSRQTPAPSLSTPLLPFIPIDPTGNYRQGRQFDRCEWEVPRETSVPVPCTADVDYFEHHYAGGISSDGAFEGGYQDGFEEVLRLFPSESVWLSSIVVMFEPAVFVPSHRHLHPQSLRATT